MPRTDYLSCHSITTGPIIPQANLGETLRVLSLNGVDAIILHKGRSRCFNPIVYSSLSLIIHLSASTVHAPDPNAKRVVSSVEEALALGADAVSVHVNIGSSSEPEQLRDLSQTAKDCEQCGIPLLAMMYPRGAKLPGTCDPAVLAHLTNIAADLGADLVKIPSEHHGAHDQTPGDGVSETPYSPFSVNSALAA